MRSGVVSTSSSTRISYGKCCWMDFCALFIHVQK
jgi:hypothetical protein